jgi:hypothetical protein
VSVASRWGAIVLAAFALAGCGEMIVVEQPPATRTPAPVRTRAPEPARKCVRPAGVANISFSATKYPNIRRHYERAIRAGWPRVLVLNRAGADERRARLLRGRSVRDGMDRDEYPPAVARRGVRASVAYVPSSENRSHGATLGAKLRRFCDRTRFRYVFY